MTADREKLAEYAHDAWIGWMRYLFGKSRHMPDGQVYIPKGSADRWKRQSETAYADLPEKEKESDRAEADKILALFAGAAEDTEQHPSEADLRAAFKAGEALSFWEECGGGDSPPDFPDWYAQREEQREEPVAPAGSSGTPTSRCSSCGDRIVPEDSLCRGCQLDAADKGRPWECESCGKHFSEVVTIGRNDYCFQCGEILRGQQDQVVGESLEGDGISAQVCPPSPCADLTELADAISHRRDDMETKHGGWPPFYDDWIAGIQAHRCTGISEEDREWLLREADQLVEMAESGVSARNVENTALAESMRTFFHDECLGKAARFRRIAEGVSPEEVREDPDDAMTRKGRDR